jgi:hypothetical protein
MAALVQGRVGALDLAVLLAVGGDCLRDPAALLDRPGLVGEVAHWLSSGRRVR